MLKPYIVIDETESHITYEYNTTCTYWLYTMIALLIVDVIVPTVWLMWVFTVLMMIYLFVVLIPATLTANTFRKAMKHGKIEMTGSRWSVTTPLRVTVPKAPPESP